MTGKKIVLSKNAQAVAEARYYMENENWEKCALRVAESISSVESKKNEYREKFNEMIYNMDFIPAGRILRNAGRPRGSMLNCYHIPCSDSIEEIGQFYKDCLILWSEGGGVGCNFSSLRPVGDAIMGKGGTTSGLVSWILAADALAKPIKIGGQRRAAGLASVDVSHPEVCDFIDSKMIHGAISHFNISVMVNEDFLQAVESNSEWELKFKQRVYRKIPARTIWNKITENMIKHAEPGLLNTSNLMKNNSFYYDPVSGTNPCGEAVLSPYDACDLGALVLPNFITGSVNTNWVKLERVIKIAVRFLDNVIDVNKYALKEIDIKAHNSRRIGLGVMGMADYLFMKGVRYGSKDALIEVERLMKFIRDCVYQASVELAVEKGAFPKFDPTMYGKSSFVRKLPGSLRLDIKDKGIRNVTLMSFAPTGTTSLLPEVSPGIEPLMFKAYRRADRVSERIYIHPKYKALLLSGEKIPEWFVDMTELEPKDHFEMQATVQRYVDGAVSKTINMPFGTTPEQLDRYLLEYIRDLKGVTVYVDQTRAGQVYNGLTEAEAREYLKKTGEVSTEMIDSDIACTVCELKDGNTTCEVKE